MRPRVSPVTCWELCLPNERKVESIPLNFGFLWVSSVQLRCSTSSLRSDSSVRSLRSLLDQLGLR